MYHAVPSSKRTHSMPRSHTSLAEPSNSMRPPSPAPGENEAVLASWRQLLDVATLQRHVPELADTARRPVARLAPETAGRLGLADGDPVTVAGLTGSITLPVRITEMPDRVVWVPMRSPGSEVRSQLGTAPGGVVTLSTRPAPVGGAA